MASYGKIFAASILVAALICSAVASPYVLPMSQMAGSSSSSSGGVGSFNVGHGNQQSSRHQRGNTKNKYGGGYGGHQSKTQKYGSGYAIGHGMKMHKGGRGTDIGGSSSSSSSSGW